MYYIVCFLQKIITKCSIGIGKFVKMIKSRNSLGIILNESSLIFFLQFNENLMTLMSFNGFVFLPRIISRRRYYSAYSLTNIIKYTSGKTGITNFIYYHWWWQIIFFFFLDFARKQFRMFFSLWWISFRFNEVCLYLLEIY